MTTQDIKPLTSQFFSSLIKLETDFINKNYNAETLDELVEYYSEAVEYYDSIKDQIASYFIYKIQDTLAQKKSMKLLNNQQVKLSTPKGNQVKDFFGTKGSSDPNSAASTEGGSPPPKSVSRVSFMGGIIAEQMNENSDQSDNDEDDEEEEEIEHFDQEDFELEEDDDEGLSMAEMRMRAKNRQKSARKSIATLKKKTQKLFTLQMKLQEEKASAKQTLYAVMETYTQSRLTNDKIVAANLGTQRNAYRQRLEERLNYKNMNIGNELDEGEEGAGSTVFIDNGSNSPNLGAGLLHDGGSSL